MQRYLVEVYLPRSRADEARSTGRRARAASDDLTRNGAKVRYVRMTYLPDDDTCFYVFEAASVAIVEQVCRVAELGSARIVPVIEACS